MRPVLPRHRLPADAHVTPRLGAGHYVLCPAQSVGDAIETVALLILELQAVDPRGGDCRRTQVAQSKGSFN